MLTQKANLGSTPPAGAIDGRSRDGSDEAPSYPKDGEHGLAQSPDRSEALLSYAYEGAVTETPHAVNLEDCSCRGLIGPDGSTKKAFPLPDGTTLGANMGIGLPRSATDPRLHSIRYEEGRGYWLHFSAEDNAGERKRTIALLSKNPSATTGEVTWELRGYLPEELAQAARYQLAKQRGRVSFPDGVTCTALIGFQGMTQWGLPLPDGTTLGANKGIGLPTRCTDPRLHSIRYEEGRGYWLEFSALSPGQDRRFTHVLISEHAAGEDALLDIKSDASSSGLPRLPKNFHRLTSFKQKASTQGAIETGVGPKAEKMSTFAKGEAFEQLVEILLHTKYPEERVIPQYCLALDKEAGFFGVRADYRVGDRVFEVKWGGHAENINETYTKHTKLLTGTGMTYSMIAREENENCATSLELFEGAIAGSPLQKELSAVMEYVDRLASHKRTNDLERLRNYLFSVQREIFKSDMVGEARLNALRSALLQLIEQPEAERSRFIAEATAHRYSPLEAHIHVDGVLYGDRITPRALYEENPEMQRLFYTFSFPVAARGKDSPWETVKFSDQVDRDIFVMLDLRRCDGKRLTLTEVLEQPFNQEKPVFRLPNGVRLSTHHIPGVTVIRDISELRAYLTFSPGFFEFGMTGAYLAYSLGQLPPPYKQFLVQTLETSLSSSPCRPPGVIFLMEHSPSPVLPRSFQPPHS